ncbi:MAG TPA: adenylate/guanylate cyclase domain-containing protein, partial [Acidimicrobiia bacterium]|nr:adenylate/guanylate cyclase domain-containing protein [Acidimicrobiia bacterium]
LLPIYRDEFLPKLEEARGTQIPLNDVIPATEEAIYLQTAYFRAAKALNVPPEAIDDPPDGSAWTEVHTQYHPAYRDTIDRLGYDDLFLVDPDTGAIVYSVAKNTDFATNLQVGPGSGTTLSSLVDVIVRSPEVGSVTIADFTRYNPDIAAPMAFFGSPIMQNGQLIGIIVVKISTDEINRIMTNDANWADLYLGKTGEVFAVGADGRFRSDSRLFIEDQPAYLNDAVAAGTLSEDSVSGVESADTTALFQRMDLSTLNAAEAATGDVIKTGNYLGADVFTALRPLDFAQLDWSVIVQVGQDEVLDGAGTAGRASAVTVALFVLILTFTAVVWSAHFVRPLRVLSGRLRSLSGSGKTDAAATSAGDVPSTTKTTREFAALTDGIDGMLVGLHEREQALVTAKGEKREVVRRFLPPEVVLRLEAGDRNLVERIPNATVVAIVIDGLGELVEHGSVADVRDRVDRVVTDFDEMADRNGLERVKIVGDTYYAVCGLDRPRLDHAPRSIAFARDAVELMDRSQAEGNGLAIAIGIVSGPVDAGLTGSHRLLYDTWGTTVTEASFLARSAAPDTILASESVVTQLPPDITLIEHSGSDGEPKIWQVLVEPAGSGAVR